MVIQHKLMPAMAERESADALSGELTGGKAGRGSENTVPFVAAISLSPDGHPLYAKMAPVPGFTRQVAAARFWLRVAAARATTHGRVFTSFTQ